MDLLKQAGALLGWLSGVVAGLTVTLYAFGYLATVSQQAALGLDWSVTNRDPLWFLGLGGLVIGTYVLTALPWLLLVLVVGETARVAWRALLRLAGRWTPRVGSALDGSGRKLLPWALGIAALYAVSQLTHLTDTLAVLRSILFLSEKDICTPSSSLVEDFVSSTGPSPLPRPGEDRHPRPLELAYADITKWASILLGINVYLAEVLRAGPRPAILLLVAMATTAIAVVSLPIVHGAVGLRTGLHAIEVDARAAGAPSTGGQPTEGYLVAHTVDGIWVWRPAEGRVLWLADGAYTRLSIGDRTTIRDARCGKEAGTSGENQVNEVE